MLDFEEIQVEPKDKSIDNFWGIEKSCQEKNSDLVFKPLPVYQEENRSIKSENIFGLTYEIARSRANKINDEKTNQLLMSSKIK